MIALLLVSMTNCSEEPPPPKPKKAPEPPSVVKAPERRVEPPPPPKEEPSKPPAPAAAVPKVLLDPKLPEWSETAPAQFKVKFSTSKGDFTVEVKREWAPRGADRFYGLVQRAPILTAGLMNSPAMDADYRRIKNLERQIQIEPV